MKRIILVVVFTMCNLLAIAQLKKPVVWSYKAEKISNTEFNILIKANILNKWHIYSQNVNAIPMQTKIYFNPSSAFVLIGKTLAPNPIVKYDKVVKMRVSYFEKEVVFKQRIKLKKRPTAINGTIEFMACSDKECLPADEIKFNIPIR